LDEAVKKKAAAKVSSEKSELKKRKLTIDGRAKLADGKPLTAAEEKAMTAAAKHDACVIERNKQNGQVAKAATAKVADGFQPTPKESETLEAVMKPRIYDRNHYDATEGPPKNYETI
jgi:hypothetical protein